MTEHHIATLAMRLFALYIGFRGVEGVARIAETLVSSFDISFLLFGGLFTSIFFVLLGVVIWIAAERIARYALPAAEASEGDHEAVSGDLTARTILNLSFIILGVYLLASAVVNGTSTVALWIETLDDLGGFDPNVLDQQIRESGYTAVGYLIAGLVLLLGARGLSTFFRRSWWAGADESPSSEDEVTEVEVQEWPDER